MAFAQVVVYTSNTASTTNYNPATNDNPLDSPADFTNEGGLISGTECTNASYSYTAFCVPTASESLSIANLFAAKVADTNCGEDWTGASYLVVSVFLSCEFKCSPLLSSTTPSDFVSCAENASWDFTAPDTSFECSSAPASISREVQCVANDDLLLASSDCSAATPVSTIATPSCTDKIQPVCSVCDSPAVCSGSITYDSFSWEIPCTSLSCVCVKKCTLEAITGGQIIDGFDCTDNLWNYVSSASPECTSGTFSGTAEFSRNASCAFEDSPTVVQADGGNCIVDSADTSLSISSGTCTTTPIVVGECSTCDVAPSCTDGSVSVDSLVIPLDCTVSAADCLCTKHCSLTTMTDTSTDDDFECTSSAADLVIPSYWNLDSVQSCDGNQSTDPISFSRFAACRFPTSAISSSYGSSCSVDAADTSVIIASADTTCSAPDSDPCTECNTAVLCTSGSVTFTYNSVATSLDVSCTDLDQCECSATCTKSDNTSGPCPEPDDYINDFTTLIFTDTTTSNPPQTCDNNIKISYTRVLDECTAPTVLAFCTEMEAGIISTSTPTVDCSPSTCSDCGQGQAGSFLFESTPFPLEFDPTTECVCTLASCAPVGTTDWESACTASPFVSTSSYWGAASFFFEDSVIANTEPSMCDTFDFIKWTRAVQCTFTGQETPEESTQCTDEFSTYTADMTATSDYSCADSVVSCGSGCDSSTSSTPLKVTDILNNEVLDFGLDDVDCGCTCRTVTGPVITEMNCPTLLDSGSTDFTWQKVSASADPKCAVDSSGASTDLLTTVATSIIPISSDPEVSYRCIQNGAVVEGDCSTITVPAGTSCAIESSCTSCGVVDECSFSFTNSDPILSLSTDVEAGATCADNCTCLLECAPNEGTASPILCDGVDDIDSSSSSTDDICLGDSTLGEFWDISCVYTNSASTPADCTGATDQVTIMQAKVLVGECSTAWLCLRTDGNDQVFADYVECDASALCGSTCSTTPLTTTPTPTCLVTAEANGDSTTDVKESTLCSQDSKPILSELTCTCEFFCVTDPSFEVDSEELDSDANNCATVEFTLPSACDNLSLPERSVFSKSANGVYTKLTTSPTAAEGCANCDIFRPLTEAEVVSICVPGIQCAETGSTAYSTCENDSGFPTCDSSGENCGSVLSRDTRCTWDTTKPLDDLLTTLDTQIADADADLKEQLEVVKFLLEEECVVFEAATDETLACLCTNGLSCLKKDSTSASFNDVVTCASDSNLESPCDVSSSCSQVTQAFENVFCRKTDGTYVAIMTTSDLDASECSELTFPFCAGEQSCTKELVCNNDPTVDVSFDNIGDVGTGDFTACLDTDFDDVCYADSDALFTAVTCTEDVNTEYIQARAGHCYVVSSTGTEVSDILSVAKLCPETEPTLTKPDCVDYSTCAPSIRSPVVVSTVLQDRQPATIEFEYIGPTDTASSNLNVEWSYSMESTTWNTLLTDVDATKDEVSVTLPRLDRSIGTTIYFRLFLTATSPIYVTTSGNTVARLDSCADGDVICYTSGTECVDPVNPTVSGIATCACIAPTVTDSNPFTSASSQLQCSRTAKCDEEGTQCQNGGYLSFDSSIVSSESNEFQCTSTCTCANGFDSATDCASCLTTQTCDVTQGQARATTDTACGCELCFPGFAGTFCSQCSRVASVTISDPTAFVMELANADSTTIANWFVPLTTYVAATMAVDRSFVSGNLNFSSFSSTVVVVFELTGLCEDAAFITQATTTPTAEELAAAWTNTITAASLNQSPDFVATSNTASTDFAVSEPANLATCADSCPAYAPAFSCDTYPTHPSCDTTSGPEGGDDNDDDDNTTTIIVVVVVVVGVVLIAVVVILIICCCCTDKSSSDSESTEKSQKTKQSQTDHSDHLELV